MFVKKNMTSFVVYGIKYTYPVDVEQLTDIEKDRIRTYFRRNVFVYKSKLTYEQKVLVEQLFEKEEIQKYISTKKKNNIIGYSIVATLMVIVIGFFSLYKSTEDKIKEICVDCIEFKEIPKTDWVLVKNSSNQFNLYNKKQKQFDLNNWYYNVVFNKGMFYDDLTFTVNGKEKIVSDINYVNIIEHGDDYINGVYLTENELKEKQQEEFRTMEAEQNRQKERTGEWKVCNNCPGKSCSKCFGRAYYYGKN